MKKIWLFLTMLFITSISLSQYDYYKWRHKSKDSKIVSPLCGIASAEGDITYYFRRVDLTLMENRPIGQSNYENRIVCDQAPKAAPGTNIISQNNRIIYIDENNYVTIITLQTQECDIHTLRKENARDQSKFALSETGNIYFVNSRDNKIWVYVPDGHNGYDSWSINSLPVALWSDIKTENNKVFYVNVENNVCYMSYDYETGSWNSYELTNCKVSPYSHIEVNYENVYFINESDGMLWNYWKKGLNQYGYVPLNVSMVQPHPKSEIIYDNSHLYYIGINHLLYTTFFEDCLWYQKELNCCNFSGFNNYYSLSLDQDKRLTYVDAYGILEYLEPIPYEPDRVHVKGNHLMLNDEIWSAHIVNVGFHINFNSNTGDYWIGPNNQYNWECYTERICDNQSDCDLLIMDYFKNIYRLGFRAIRFFGIGVFGLEDMSSTNFNELHISRWNMNVSPKDEDVLLYNVGKDKYFEMIESLLDKAEACGLKVIALTGCGYANFPDRVDLVDNYSYFLMEFSSRFKDHKELLAIDLFNEPYQSGGIHDKEEICEIVRGWNYSIKSQSNILSTIGLERPSDVLAWDAGIMLVDFNSFHFYANVNYCGGIDESRKELSRHIKWVYNNRLKLNKPWIIGEAGFSADEDASLIGPPDGTEGILQDQLDYAQFIVPLSYECNSQAFSWWQYHEIRWNKDYSRYLGLVDFYDQKKLIVDADNDFFNATLPQNQDCGCNPPNFTQHDYYNFKSSYSKALHGRIVDEFLNPISDAVILAFDDDWNFITYTYSQSDEDIFSKGEFSLTYSTLQNIDKLKVSALNKSVGIKYELKDLPNNSTLDDISLDDIQCYDIADQAIEDDNSVARAEEYFNKDEQTEFFLFPNPANDKVIIKSSRRESIGNYVLFSSQGNRIIDGLIISNQTEIDISNLNDGMYILVINTGVNIETHKLIKNNSK